MAFLVEIGLNNPSSGASTYDVYITDFDVNTGWIQVVSGITYNQFPVIVNTDDYPDVNHSIKYKIVSDNGCECEGCPGEPITVTYAHEDQNGVLTNFNASNTTYSEMETILCNYGSGQSLLGNGNYKIQKHGSNVAIGDAIFYSWNDACNPYSNRIFYLKETLNIIPGYYVVTDGNGIITQLDYIDCTSPTATPIPTLTETPNPTPSETPDATPIPTPNPTASPTPSETPDATPNPTASPTPTPTEVSIQGCIEFDYTSNLLEYGYVVSGETGYESLYVQVPSQTGPTTNDTTYERWPSVYPNALPDGIICDVVFNVNGVEYSAVYDYEEGGTGGSTPHGVFRTNGSTLSYQYVFQISRIDQNGDDFYSIFTDFDPSSDSVKITVRGDCVPDPTSTPIPTVTPTPTEAPDVDVSGMTKYLYDIDGYTPVGSEEYFVIRHLNLDGNYRDLIIGYDANNTGGNFSFASYEDPVVLTGGTITFTKSQWSLDEKFGSWQGSDYGYFGPTREIAVSNAWNQFTSCNLGSGARTYNTLHNNPSSLVDGWIMQRVTTDVIAQFPDLIKPVGREGGNMVWAQFRGGAIAKTTGTPDYGNTNMGTTVFEQGTGQITQKLNLVPWLRLTSQNSSVDEGTQVTITLECYGLSGTYPNGVDFPYTITGIDSSDLSSGSITGIINAVHPNPYANETEGNITFTIATDSVIENETLRLTLDDYNEGSDEGHSIYIDIDINDV